MPPSPKGGPRAWPQMLGMALGRGHGMPTSPEDWPRGATGRGHVMPLSAWIGPNPRSRYTPKSGGSAPNAPGGRLRHAPASYTLLPNNLEPSPWHCPKCRISSPNSPGPRHALELRGMAMRPSQDMLLSPRGSQGMHEGPRTSPRHTLGNFHKS